VLLVNRVTPLLDPAHVRLRMRSARALGTPSVVVMSNPFTRAPETPRGLPPVQVIRPWPCKLTTPATLTASSLARISSRGAPIAGFDLTHAIAAAYDAVCGFTYPAAFRQAVHPAPAPCVLAPLCCPPNAMCVPPPGEPPPPGCPPCVPRTGHVCPLAKAAYVCIARTQRRTP
jgi:hypothetical protein